MKISSSITVLAVLTALSSTTAAVAESNVPIQGYHKSFGGFFASLTSGIDKISGKIHSEDVSTTGIGYEASIGYRYQTNENWVFGLEGSLSDRTGSISDPHRTIEFDYIWRWTAIAGKAFGANNNNLVYGKLGVGGIQVNPDISGANLSKQNFEGNVFGLGYERAFSRRMSLRIETSYISYDPAFDQYRSTLGIVTKF